MVRVDVMQLAQATVCQEFTKTQIVWHLSSSANFSPRLTLENHPRADALSSHDL
jgi:hypothetical protein